MKGFFFSQPPMALWAEYPGLRVYVAQPEYVLAMKAAAGRPQDIADIEAIAAHLHLTTANEVLGVVTRYIPSEHLSSKTQYLIQSLFP